MTLIELLTALAITALITSIVSFGLVQVIDRSDRLNEGRVALENDLAAARAFRRVVERAYTVSPSSIGQDGISSFLMTENGVYWTAIEPGYPETAGLYAYGLEIIRNGVATLAFRRQPLPRPIAMEGRLDDLLANAPATEIWRGTSDPILLAYDAEAAIWTTDWSLPEAPTLVGLALPGLPLQTARIPSASFTASQPTEAAADRPGIGAIEPAPDVSE